jgi:hypothetical protein
VSRTSPWPSRAAWRALSPPAVSRNRSGFVRSKIDAVWTRRERGWPSDVSLCNYLLLVDFTGGLFRDKKARISAELAGVFERLGCTADRWTARLERLSQGRLLGRFFAGSKAKLREIAARLNLHHLVNLAGCSLQ